jgi:hypothetical protein
LLESSNGRAYWLLLAECSGFYGALSNKAANDTDRQAFLSQGVETFRLALNRIQRDRGLDREAAIDVLDPYVQRARVLGENSLDQTPATPSSSGLTPRLVMTSTCTSVRQVYDRMS